MVLEAHTMVESIELLGAGAFGALAKDCFVDGELVLPHTRGNALVLGFIGGAIVGAFVGYVIDGSIVSAAMAGFTGASILPTLLNKSTNGKAPEVPPVENGQSAKPEVSTGS